MHPENWPESIKDGDFFCIADINCDIENPNFQDQMMISLGMKYLGAPLKFNGFFGACMILANDKIGPLPIPLKYIGRAVRLTEEEVQLYYSLMPNENKQ